MTAAERAEFEILLEADPVARQGRGGDPLGRCDAGDRAGARALLRQGRAEGIRPHAYEKPAGKIVRFPQFYYRIVSGLAAACFAVFFAYVEQSVRQLAYDEKHYVELPLQANEASVAAPAPARDPVPEAVAVAMHPRTLEGDAPAIADEVDAQKEELQALATCR